MTIKLFIMMYALGGFAVGLSLGILLTLLVLKGKANEHNTDR